MTKQLRSFGELAELIASEDLIANTWTDIQDAMSGSDAEAFERAVARLQQKFATADEFKAAISGCSFNGEAGIETRVLYHFAARWKEQEGVRGTIEKENGALSSDANEVISYPRGNSRKSKDGMSRDQLKKLQDRKERRRKEKKRLKKKEEEKNGDG